MSLNDGRLGLNLAVSSGQELTVSIAEYLDYAVESYFALVFKRHLMVEAMPGAGI